MQYSTLLLSALAATGALAAPKGTRSGYNVDNQIRVILSDLYHTNAQVTLPGDQQSAQWPDKDGPFRTIEIQVGKDVQNQDIRCTVEDETGKPIIANRGANTDITFADGGNGPWTFKQDSLIKKVVCDPAFVKAEPADFEVRVILQNQGIELGTQTPLETGVRAKSAPIGSHGPYKTVELSTGRLVDDAYRCQILDNAGKPITVVRGANVDTTFSDAGKGLWTFHHFGPDGKGLDVSSIICDHTFVASPQ